MSIRLNRAIALLTSAVLPLVSVCGAGYSLSLHPQGEGGAIAQAEDCSTLIGAANQAVGEIQAVVQTNPGDGGGPPLLAIAAAADQAVGHLQSITLADPQLQNYQAQFIDIYATTGQASRDLVAAVEQDNIAGARDAYATILRANSLEGPLVSEIQVYCGANSG